METGDMYKAERLLKKLKASHGIELKDLNNLNSTVDSSKRGEVETEKEKEE